MPPLDRPPVGPLERTSPYGISQPRGPEPGKIFDGLRLNYSPDHKTGNILLVSTTDPGTNSLQDNPTDALPPPPSRTTTATIIRLRADHSSPSYLLAGLPFILLLAGLHFS